MPNYLMNSTSSNHPWYALQCQTRREKITAESLVAKVKADNLSDCISSIVVIEEKVMVNRNNRVIETTKPKFPGYIYVNGSFSAVKQLAQNVKDSRNGENLFVRIVGLNNNSRIMVNPALRNDEVIDLGLVSDSSVEKAEVEAVSPFRLNEVVRVVDGPFNNYSGKVSSVDVQNKAANIEFSIFGRPQFVSIPFDAIRTV